ncbi:unnamed protein product [Anisakis simplex]|uniref:THUMP domain-containing protein n=1 Tax=Anisakis simplex TaxID=6269 RepID=A0A0M3KKG3_ANISI|nr:unnamed protein product [Anisakis simplex]
MPFSVLGYRHLRAAEKGEEWTLAEVEDDIREAVLTSFKTKTTTTAKPKGRGSAVQMRKLNDRTKRAVEQLFPHERQECAKTANDRDSRAPAMAVSINALCGRDMVTEEEVCIRTY